MNTRASLLSITAIEDERGVLTFAEVEGQLPFTPVRYFALTGVPPNAVRGEHAHRACQQVVVVLSGSCRVQLRDGVGHDDVTLDSPTVGLHIPAMVWAELSSFAPDTVTLVLASEPYDAGDYIRSFPEFMRIVAPA